MAEVRVSRHEAESGMLPRVCICCGDKSSRYRRVTLSMTAGSSFDSALTALPEFLQRFILESISPVLAVIFPLTTNDLTRSTIRAPLCRRHRHHWLWHRLILLSVATLTLAAAVVTLLYLGRMDIDIPLLATAGGLALWLLVLCIQRRWMVHAADGSRSTITLAAVATEFVAAVKEQEHRSEQSC